MGVYTCCVCSSDFEIPDETVARYRRWTPKYCRRHAFVGMARSRPFGLSPTRRELPSPDSRQRGQ